jgi:regulatory protein
VPPDAGLERALAVAYRYLNQRERTETEVRARLERADGVERSDAEQAIAILLEQGYLDDARFARQFAEDRRRLDGWGAERIERRLHALGIDAELIAAAVAEQDSGAELDAALALLRRRFPDPPATPRDCERALGVLVRKGYELELAHDALRRHAGAPAFD